MSETPGLAVQAPAGQKVPVTLGQAAWALMFVVIYVAVTFSVIIVLGLTGVIERTLESFLSLFFVGVTAASYLALYFHLFRRNKLTPADLGFRRPTARIFHLLWQIPVTIIACACLQGLSLALFALLGADTASAGSATSMEIGGLPVPLAVIAVLVMTVFTPVWEELLFRGALLDGLSRRFRPASAIIISAAIFAAIHIVPLGFVYLFALGIALAILRCFHQNLWAPVLLHAVNNAVVVLVALIAIQFQS